MAASAHPSCVREIYLTVLIWIFSFSHQNILGHLWACIFITCVCFLSYLISHTGFPVRDECLWLEKVKALAQKSQTNVTMVFPKNEEDGIKSVALKVTAADLFLFPGRVSASEEA